MCAQVIYVLRHRTTRVRRKKGKSLHHLVDQGELLALLQIGILNLFVRSLYCRSLLGHGLDFEEVAKRTEHVGVHVPDHAACLSGTSSEAEARQERHGHHERTSRECNEDCIPDGLAVTRRLCSSKPKDRQQGTNDGEGLDREVVTRLQDALKGTRISNKSAPNFREHPRSEGLGLDV